MSPAHPVQNIRMRKSETLLPYCHRGGTLLPAASLISLSSVEMGTLASSMLRVCHSSDCDVRSPVVGRHTVRFHRPGLDRRANKEPDAHVCCERVSPTAHGRVNVLTRRRAAHRTGHSIVVAVPHCPRVHSRRCSVMIMRRRRH